MMNKRNNQKCGKCNGTGEYRFYLYNVKGVCYACNGTGASMWSAADIEKADKMYAQEKARDRAMEDAIWAAQGRMRSLKTLREFRAHFAANRGNHAELIAMRMELADRSWDDAAKKLGEYLNKIGAYNY